MSDDECEPIFALVAAVFRQAVRDAKRGCPKARYWLQVVAPDEYERYVKGEFDDNANRGPDLHHYHKGTGRSAAQMGIDAADAGGEQIDAGAHGGHFRELGKRQLH